MDHIAGMLIRCESRGIHVLIYQHILLLNVSNQIICLISLNILIAVIPPEVNGVGVWPNTSTWMQDELRSRSRSIQNRKQCIVQYMANRCHFTLFIKY